MLTAADMLLAARRDPARRLATLPQPPADQRAAYAIQHAVMRELGEIGGWKVGAAGPDGPMTCAPLPASSIIASPARIPQRDCPDRAVEAEIALQIGASLPPRSEPYAEAKVLGAVASAHPAIELLQSRYLDPGAVDPLSQLADAASNFALVWGDAIPEWEQLDFSAEAVRVLVNGQEATRGIGNPGGGMARMLAWLANEGARWAGGLKAGAFVTTGSWTGKDIVPPGGRARVIFDHCGTAEAVYE